MICEKTIRTENGAPVNGADGNPLTGEALRTAQLRRTCKLSTDQQSSSLLSDADAATVRQAVATWNKTFPQIQFKFQDSLGDTKSLVAFQKSEERFDYNEQRYVGSHCGTDGVGLNLLQPVKGVFIGSECTTRLTSGTTGTGTSVWVVLHEMMHVVGVYHEQARNDAWQFLDVAYLPAAAGRSCNMDELKRQYKTQGEPRGDYDFGSVMQYPLRPKEARGCHVQTSLTPFGAERLKEQHLVINALGAEHPFSQDDLLGVRTLYP